MRMLTALVAVVLLSLLSTKPCDGQAITAGPANTAALTGSSVQLNCSATMTENDLAWSYLNATTSSYVKIYQSKSGIIQGFEDRYEISVNENEYNLIVKEVNPSAATKYECQLAMSANVARYADLLAVEEVQCPQPSVEVIEGTELLLPCGVAYHFSQQPSAEMTPVLSWSIGESQNNSIQVPFSNSSYVENVLNVTLHAQDDDTEFICNLQFNGVDAPDYTASCATIVYVLYGVNDIVTEPNITEGQELEVGTVITCIPNGRPAPIVAWLYDNGTYGASDNENLTVTEDMVDQGPLTFICRANNTVANATYEVQTQVTFVAVAVSVQPVATHGVETWVIVVAVVVPVVVLAAAGIAAFFIYRHYRKGKKSKTSGTNGTATTATFTAAQPVESQPFLHMANQPLQQPIASPRSANDGVSYQPNGSQSRAGFADLGSDGAIPVAASAVGVSIGGSQYSGSSSRIATPNPMSYPYSGPTAAVPNGVNGGPAPVVGGRGTPAITAGPQLAAYAGSTGRLTPATDVSMRTNPTAYPYTGTARQMSNASDASRGSSYHGGSRQNVQPPPLSYPPARPGSSHNSSLV